MPEGDTVFRTAARLHQALAGEPLTTTDLRWPDLSTLDFRGVHHAGGRQPGEEHPPATRQRRDHPLPPADGRPVAGRRDRPPHRPQPLEPADPRRGRHPGLDRRRPPSRRRCTSSRPPTRAVWSVTSAPTCSVPTGTRRSRPAGPRQPHHDRRRSARPAQPRRRRHPLRRGGPLPRTSPPVDAGGRPRPGDRGRGRRPRAYPPRPRPAPCRPDDDGQPAPGRDRMGTRAVGASVSPLRRDGAGRDGRRGASGADDVLLPAVPGRPGPHRRRSTAASTRNRQAQRPRARWRPRAPSLTPT